MDGQTWAQRHPSVRETFSREGSGCRSARGPKRELYFLFLSCHVLLRHRCTLSMTLTWRPRPAGSMGAPLAGPPSGLRLRCAHHLDFPSSLGIAANAFSISAVSRWV